MLLLDLPAERMERALHVEGASLARVLFVLTCDQYANDVIRYGEGGFPAWGIPPGMCGVQSECSARVCHQGVLRWIVCCVDRCTQVGGRACDTRVLTLQMAMTPCICNLQQAARSTLPLKSFKSNKFIFGGRAVRRCITVSIV